MKKILLLIASLACGMAYGQSIEITNPVTDYTSDYLEDAHVDYVIKNVSGSTKNFKASREIIKMHSSHQNYFCWTNCYAPTVDVSPDVESMEPGELFTLVGSLAFDESLKTGNVGETVIKYCIFDADNESDKTCIEITYRIMDPRSMIVPRSTVYQLDNEMNYWDMYHDGEEMIVEFDVENFADENMEVMVTREKLSGPAAHVNYFCWGNCFEPDQDTSPINVDMTTGESESFRTHLLIDPDIDPDLNKGTSVYRFCFVNADDMTDSVCMDLSFRVDVPTGIEELSHGGTVIGIAYPNPSSSGQINFPYRSTTSSGVKIEMINALGQTVLSLPLPRGEGTLITPSQSIKPGLYFYRLSSDSGKSKAQKMIIK